MKSIILFYLCYEYEERFTWGVKLYMGSKEDRNPSLGPFLKVLTLRVHTSPYEEEWRHALSNALQMEELANVAPHVNKVLSIGAN